MFLWNWNYVPVGLKLCSCGIEAMFLWDWSYVLVGLKLCSQCCNAIEKDCSLRREWSKATQRTIVCQAAKTSVENRVLHEWEEGHYPGGFIKLISGLVGIRVDDEMSRASRIPAGILLLTLSIVPFVFDTTPLIIVAVATFGFIECFVHTMGIRLFLYARHGDGMVGVCRKRDDDSLSRSERYCPVVWLCLWSIAHDCVFWPPPEDHDTHGGHSI